MCTLYERIIELCRKKGVSGSRMCLDLGLSKSTLSDMKHGRTKGLTAVTAQKIASYLGVTVGYLLGEEENSENEKIPVAINDEDIKVALFGGDTEVTDEMWHEVMNYAEFLKQKYKKN